MSELGIIAGKTFLVTGGASGLGAGYVESFLKDGAKTVAILDIAEKVGKEYSEKLNKVYPGKVVFIKCDCSNENSLTEAFNAAVDKLKTVDVVINNAGVMDDTPNVWRLASDINYMEPFHQRTGVRIIVMCFGATDTPLLQNMDKKIYDDKCYKEVANTTGPTDKQKSESAVKGVVEAFKQGANGTIWLVTNDRPAQDITGVIDDAFNRIQNTLYPQ